MKNYQIIILAALSFFLTSQELDEEYLNSLPADIRDDLNNKLEAKKETEGPVYRRASTALDKDQEEEEEEDNPVFGSAFFDTIQSSFMPTNEPNLDSSYVLDFGDVLEVQLIGQKNFIESFAIKRDGSINVPEIGKLVLSGLSLADASSLIKAKIESAYIGTNAYISLQNIRDISVLIAGNAFNPGIYTLNGNSNMLHALSMAGGIDDIGSYRNINLIRNGKTVDTLDIYDVLIYGKNDFQKGLRSGDSILVNPPSKIVSIESGVMRPARYELKDDETLEDLIRYASGFSPNAIQDSIIIKRIQNGEIQTFDINSINLRSFKFMNGDSVYISEYKLSKISIIGAVKNPGTYVLENGTTLSQLIGHAGGYENTAYPFGGFLNSKRALQINIDAKDKLYDTFLENLILNASPVSSSDSSIGFYLQQLKEADVTGRVIAEFDIDMIKNNPELDTTLEDGDQIIIPNITQQVFIQGEVSNPGAIRYSPGMDIKYYIDGAGGQLDTADMKNLFIVHPNGETQILKSNSGLSLILAEPDRDLIYPGSIIYIPQKTNYANSLEVASVWAPILSSIALSITSLSVLNNSN